MVPTSQFSFKCEFHTVSYGRVSFEFHSSFIRVSSECHLGCARLSYSPIGGIVRFLWAPRQGRVTPWSTRRPRCLRRPPGLRRFPGLKALACKRGSCRLPRLVHALHRPELVLEARDEGVDLVELVELVVDLVLRQRLPRPGAELVLGGLTGPKAAAALPHVHVVLGLGSVWGVWGVWGREGQTEPGPSAQGSLLGCSYGMNTDVHTIPV